MKNVCYWHQTSWNHHCCNGLIAGTCQKEHITAANKTEYDFIPIPPEQLTAWKEHSIQLKQLGYVPVTPATKASSKGQAKGKGKDGAAPKGKGKGKEGKNDGGKGDGKTKGKEGKKGKGKKGKGKGKATYAGAGVATEWAGTELTAQDWQNAAAQQQAAAVNDTPAATDQEWWDND